MPIGPARMPLFDHLGELRRRLTIIVVTMLVTIMVMYFATPVVIDILKDPIARFLPTGGFIVTGALGGFTIKFNVAFKVAFVMCTPLIMWQIMGFFLPALREKERKWFTPTVFSAVVLFYLGALFCYFAILPATFGFLVEESASIGTVMPEAVDFINIELLLMIGFGVAFELPLIVFYLAVFHIVPYTTFREAWRYIYVILLVISGVVTPDASPVTMICLYAAMMLLYEGALAVTRIVILKREGKEGLSYGRISLFDDDDEDE